MRIPYLLGLSLITAIFVAGCGSPEPEFSSTQRMEKLLPSAQKATKEYVQERFGTPSDMVAWRRLPIAFGGISGKVIDYGRNEQNDLITHLKVDFTGQAMIVKYDANMDGKLAYSEFPIQLQEDASLKRFNDADADGDGFLNATEILKLKTRSDLFSKDYVSAITEENKDSLVGQTLTFVNGSFADQTTKVKSFDVDDSLVEVYPPLSDKVSAKDEEAIDITIDEVIVDFGGTMKSGRHLYMRHCMHCHGVTGDGNGPTAEYLNPLPRDYRLGLFKFVSTERATVTRPCRDDLTLILKNGIPGTYMPSFSQLKEKELSDIVEYVRWLSMRGEYESTMVKLLGAVEGYSQDAVDADFKSYERKLESFEKKLAAEETTEDKRPKAESKDSIRRELSKKFSKYAKEDLYEAMDGDSGETDLFLEKWRKAEVHANIIYPEVAKPSATPASIARGRALYLGKCAVCHGVTALGNGDNTKGYQKDANNKEYPVPGFFDAWGNPIKPRNLTTGIYRGGRRPLDIYRRISQGIPGTPMQAFASAFKDEDIWDLVDYIMSIPIDGPVPSSVENIAESEAETKPEETKPKAAMKSPDTTTGE